MQLVEIIRALQTNDATCDRIVKLAEDIGKKARVSKDSYGFVVNRVLVPMINEAINCVYEGLATPDDVDQMMKLGANHPMGPLSLADLIGLDIVLDIIETLITHERSALEPGRPRLARSRCGDPGCRQEGEEPKLPWNRRRSSPTSLVVLAKRPNKAAMSGGGGRGGKGARSEGWQMTGDAPGAEPD